MVHTLSLAHQMIRCVCGVVRNLTTFESRPKIPLMTSHTPDGFFLQTDKGISCLSHLMHGCPTLPTSLLYLLLPPPQLISPTQPLGLNGMIVTFHSFPFHCTPLSYSFGNLYYSLSCACSLWCTWPKHCHFCTGVELWAKKFEFFFSHLHP